MVVGAHSFPCISRFDRLTHFHPHTHTQVGKNVQALWIAATAQRYKKIGEDLTVMCESFRVYDGVAPA